MQVLFFFSSQFTVIAHGLDLFSVAYLNKFTVPMVPSVRTALSKGPARLDAFLHEDSNSQFPKPAFLKSICKKNKIVSVKFIHALCSCLSTHDYMVMQAMVWPCLFQDRVIQFGAVRVRSVLHTQM